MTMAAKGLAKLIEELGELQQVCGKKLAYYHTDIHPDGKAPLSDRMIEEMGDVIAAIFFVADNFEIDPYVIEDRAAKKLNLFRRWHSDPDNAIDAIDAAREVKS